MPEPSGLPLFDVPAQKPRLRFDGADYRPDRDDARLTGQLQDIFTLMKDGQFRTLERIAFVTNHPPASISAQLRHLRRKRFGAHTVNRRYDGGGLYSYQLIVAKS